MTGTAFSEGKSSREALLAKLEGPDGEPRLWLTYAAEAECIAAGTEYGFHPAFTLLVDSLARGNEIEGRKAFVTEVVRALPLQADTGAIVRRWFLRTWDEDLSGILADSPAIDAPMPIVQLVRAGIEAEVPPKAWRSARSALARAEALDGNVADAAQVLLAMAWDLDQAPGAATDTVIALHRSAMQAANRTNGWTAELGEELATIETTIRERAAAAVREQVGEMTTQPDKATQELVMRIFREESERQLAEWPRAAELTRQREECWKQGAERFASWVEVARSRLISIAADLPSRS
jgi:hypothetical protein